jgi:hypothetical protein
VPIDFAGIAARFGDQLAEQTHSWPFLFDRFEDAVKKLVEQSDKAERATRGYPIFRYRDGALAVHVDLLGAELLPSGSPQLGFVAGLEAGGRRFLGELGWARTAVEQELALPRMLAVVREGVDAVVNSIDRFRRPDATMFDDRARRISDVFGLLALVYNSLLGAEAGAQMIGAAKGAAGLIGEVRKLSPPSDDPSDKNVVDTIVDAAEGIGEQLLATVVLLPMLGEALAVLIHDGALAAKRATLTALMQVEAEVHALRSAAIDDLLRGIGLGQLAADWLFAARLVVLNDIGVLAVAVPSFVQTLLAGLRSFAEGLSAWGRWLAGLMLPLRIGVNLFMSFDLIGWVLRKFLDFLPNFVLKRIPHPHITIADLVTYLLGEGAGWVKTSIDHVIDVALRVINTVGYLPGVNTDKLYYRVEALGEVFNQVLTRTPPPPPDVMPKLPLAGFPDVYDAMFGGGREAGLVSSLDAFGAETRGGIRSALGATSTMFDRLGTTFAAEADRAVGNELFGRVGGLAADSAAFAERVFGPEADRLRAEAASSQPDALAAGFEQAVTSGGFALVGGAIPAYVEEMRRFWATKRPPEPPPTSPHILARHGRLGGVRVPRLTVRASGRVADRQLAALVAARFHDEVGEAYVGGRREFERLGGAPLRRPPARPRGRKPVTTRSGAGSGS